MRTTEGVVGFATLARPFRKEYATLSLWIDDSALDTFAGSAPHAQLREELAEDMGPTTFVRWTVSGHDGSPSWRDAFARLREPTSGSNRNEHSRPA